MPVIGGLILAGGRSSRMGENKLLLPFGPARLIDWVAARLETQCTSIALNCNEAIAGLPALPRIQDDIEGHAGPLAGIAAGLAHFRKHQPDVTHLLTVAADTPFFPENLREGLEASLETPEEIAVAVSADLQWQPTFALWPVGIEDALRLWLSDRENRKLRAFIARYPHKTVPFAAHSGLKGSGEASIDPFFNINTPDDYHQALGILEGMA